MAAPLSAPARQRKILAELRESAEARLARHRAALDELDTGDIDVGAGDDEGGGEADGTAVERDRLRALAAEEVASIEAIDAASARTKKRGWDKCERCTNPIGAERLEAMPMTTLCVTCKAAGIYG